MSSLLPARGWRRVRSAGRGVAAGVFPSVGWSKVEQVEELSWRPTHCQSFVCPLVLAGGLLGGEREGEGGRE